MMNFPSPSVLRSTCACCKLFPLSVNFILEISVFISVDSVYLTHAKVEVCVEVFLLLLRVSNTKSKEIIKRSYQASTQTTRVIEPDTWNND